MLIDKDTNPKDTIFYISVVLLENLKERGRVRVNSVNQIFRDIAPNQPSYKLQLSLNFLFLIDKIIIEEGELVYVP